MATWISGLRSAYTRVASFGSRSQSEAGGLDDDDDLIIEGPSGEAIRIPSPEKLAAAAAAAADGAETASLSQAQDQDEHRRASETSSRTLSPAEEADAISAVRATPRPSSRQRNTVTPFRPGTTTYNEVFHTAQPARTVIKQLWGPFEDDFYTPTMQPARKTSSGGDGDGEDTADDDTSQTLSFGRSPPYQATPLAFARQSRRAQSPRVGTMDLVLAQPGSRTPASANSPFFEKAGPLDVSESDLSDTFSSRGRASWKRGTRRLKSKSMEDLTVQQTKKSKVKKGAAAKRSVSGREQLFRARRKFWEGKRVAVTCY